MTSSEILRKRAQAQLLRERATIAAQPTTPTGPEIAPSATLQNPATSPIVAAVAVPASPAQKPPEHPIQNRDGTWSFGGVNYAHGHDAWATFPPRKKAARPVRPDWRAWLTVTKRDGSPWSSEAASTSAQRRAVLRQLCIPTKPWREWPVVTRADGTLWGEPAHAGHGGIDRWIRKIAAELAAEVGVSLEESALCVEANRELIADRFANGIARAEVVQELHELMKAARIDPRRVTQNGELESWL